MKLSADVIKLDGRGDIDLLLRAIDCCLKDDSLSDIDRADLIVLKSDLTQLWLDW